ncbi:MAG: response regulator [Halorhodospira sp.]
MEDNALNREVAGELLADTGVTYDTAENGQQALERLANETYDLVLMDIQMPELDGLSATRQLRAAGHTLPVLAMTAHALAGDADKSLEAGMDEHITKPIDPDELYAALGNWLGVAASSAAPQPAGSTTHLPDLTDLGLDTAILKRHVPSGGQRALRLLRDFAADAPARAQALWAAAEDEDMATLTQQAHALKSATAHLGATELSQRATQAEGAAREGEAATAVAEAQALAQALAELGPALQERLADAAAEQGGRANPARARDLIARLRPLLAEADAAAEDLLEELEAAVGGDSRLSEEVGWIREAFDDLELAAAAEHLDALEEELALRGESP